MTFLMSFGYIYSLIRKKVSRILQIKFLFHGWGAVLQTSDNEMEFTCTKNYFLEHDRFSKPTMQDVVSRTYTIHRHILDVCSNNWLFDHRTRSTNLNGKTPIKFFIGNCLHTNFRVFRSLCYAHNQSEMEQ